MEAPRLVAPSSYGGGGGGGQQQQQQQHRHEQQQQQGRMPSPSHGAPSPGGNIHVSTSPVVGGNNSTLPGSKSPSLVKAQEDIVRQFASYLSTKGTDGSGSSNQNRVGSGTPSSDQQRSKQMLQYLSEQVEDHDVVLVLPSLDMRAAEDNSSGGSGGAGGKMTAVVPKLGESKATVTAIRGCATASPSPSSPQQPPTLSKVGSMSDFLHRSGKADMAASVLTLAGTHAPDQAAKVEEKAAVNMNKTTSWTRSTVTYASQAVTTNVTEFFTKLIDSRLRAWTLLLLRHSLSTGDTQSRTRLLSMLSASIQVKSAEVVYKTLSLPESAAGQIKEADVILPLLFEVVLHLTIQEKSESVTLRAPGTVSAYFDETGRLIKKFTIRIDTGVLLTGMVDHARIIVFKAVANATKAPVPPGPIASSSSSLITIGGGDSSPNTPPGSGGGSGGAGGNPSNPAASSPGGYDNINPADPSGGTPTSPFRASAPVSSLSRFRSALNLTSAPKPTNEAPGLQKARASALRLNSVLQGKGSASTANLGAVRRNRSVKWDTPLQIPRVSTTLGVVAPSPKKQRMAENAAKLKSFKSFGRPHAGDFGSGPRNATFGEYGGHARMWGRDGRLAHHPAPMQVSGGMHDTSIGLTGVADKNATFDSMFRNHRTSHRPPSAALAAAVGRGGLTAAQGGGPALPPSAIPRTTTGLEKWLIKTSTR